MNQPFNTSAPLDLVILSLVVDELCDFINYFFFFFLKILIRFWFHLLFDQFSSFFIDNIELGGRG
jgi:hypothetical protein